MVKSDSEVVSKPTALTPILCQRYTKVGWDTLSGVDLKVPARVWSARPSASQGQAQGGDGRNHLQKSLGDSGVSPLGEGQLAPFCLC